MTSAVIMALGAAIGATSAWWLVTSVRSHADLRLRTATTLAGAAIGVLSVRPGQHGATAWLSLLFAAGLVAIATCDLAERRIPNRLSYPLFVVALAMCWAWPGRSAVATLIGVGVALGIVVGMAVPGVLLTGPSHSASGVGVGDRCSPVVGRRCGTALADDGRLRFRPRPRSYGACVGLLRLRAALAAALARGRRPGHRPRSFQP